MQGNLLNVLVLCTRNWRYLESRRDAAAFWIGSWWRRMKQLLFLVLYRLITSRDSSVNIVTRLRVGRPGRDSRQGQGIFSS